MRVFVFTYDRYDTINTTVLLDAEGIDHTTLCHTDEQAARFADAGRVRPETLVVTGNPRGLAFNRNAALDLMDEGEWALFLVDDLIDVTILDTYDTEPEPLTLERFSGRYWKQRFGEQLSLTDFMRRAEQGIERCDRSGCHLLGWDGIGNPLYRRKHWSRNTLADGRAWAVRKGDLRFDEHAQMIDDLCWTALNIQHYGIVLVDRWILPRCKRYTAGAFGSIEQRLPQKLSEARYLVDTYPHLIRYKRKPGWPDGSHVVLRTIRPTS